MDKPTENDCPMIQTAYDLATKAEGYKIPDDYEIDDGLKHREARAHLRHMFTNYDNLVSEVGCFDDCPYFSEGLDSCEDLRCEAKRIVKMVCYDALDIAQRG